MYNTFKYSLDKSAKITKFNTYSPNHLSANHSPPAEGCPKAGWMTEGGVDDRRRGG